MQVRTAAANFIFSTVVVATSVAGVVGCTVNAPPPEDLSGDALTVSKGRLQIDSDKVPVVTEPCTEGQSVVRSADGWACAPVVVGVSAGPGLSGGGAGDVSLAVDFGDGDSQVASGARTLALESAAAATTSNVADLDDRVVTLEGQGLDARVEALEGQSLDDRVAGLEGQGLDARVETLEEQLAVLPTPTIIAAYDVNSRNGTLWNAIGVGEPLFLGTDIGSVQIAGPPPVSGIGRVSGGGAVGGGPLGQRLLVLPARDFAIEMVAQGSEQIFVHGTDGLSLQVFGTEVVVREFGRDLRFTPPAFSSSSPNHLVYVHTATDERQLFVNGTRIAQSSASGWTGPYLGERGVFSLGSRSAGAAGSSPVYFKVVIHGAAPNAAAVFTACKAAESAGILNSGVCRSTP
jgi:hypothetical protein